MLSPRQNACSKLLFLFCFFNTKVNEAEVEFKGSYSISLSQSISFIFLKITTASVINRFYTTITIHFHFGMVIRLTFSKCLSFTQITFNSSNFLIRRSTIFPIFHEWSSVCPFAELVIKYSFI